jgi:hypothetical protein
MDMALNPDSNMSASLIANGGMLFGLSYRNVHTYKNLRRPNGCKCRGCKNFRLTKAIPPNGLSDTAYSELIRCENAFLAWLENINNLVMTEGKNDQLTQYFKGSAYTAAFFIGLVNNAGFTAYAAGDTAAQIGGTNGWAEGTPYSNATRVAWVGGTASGGSIDNSGSVATFNINATLTVRGGFVATSSTKNGTSGKLYGAVDFSATRSVVSGDTLLTTASFTLV